jgi:two-component system cell cycle response regulator DivK
VVVGQHEPERHGEEDTAVRSPSSTGTTDEAPGPLVLIVDDNERNLKLARDVLRAGGLRTLEAVDGRGALALAAEQRPDVILMDIRLPDLDGTIVAERLKADSLTAAIPVVALTALEAGEGHWLHESGFDGSLEKPIDVTEFADQVRAYCR